MISSRRAFSWTLYDSAIFLRKIWRAFIALLSCLHFILQHCGRWCWLSRSHSDEHDSFDPGMPGSYPSSAHRPQYEMQGSIQLDSPAVSPLQVGGEVNNMEKVTSLVELQNVSECSQKTEHATSTPTEDSPRTLALAVDGVQSIEATNDDNTSSEEAQSPEDTELSAHVTSNYSTHFEPSSSDDSDDETGPSGERPRSAWSMTDIFQEFGGRHHSRSTEEGDTLNDQRDTHQETPINGAEDAQGQVDCPLFREIVYGSPRQTSQYVGRPFQSPPVSPRTRTSEGLVARRIRALHMNIERPAIDRDVGRARQERVQLNLVQERIQHFEEQSRRLHRQNSGHQHVGDDGSSDTHHDNQQPPFSQSVTDTSPPTRRNTDPSPDHDDAPFLPRSAGQAGRRNALDETEMAISPYRYIRLPPSSDSLASSWTGSSPSSSGTIVLHSNISSSIIHSSRSSPSQSPDKRSPPSVTSQDSILMDSLRLRSLSPTTSTASAGGHGRDIPTHGTYLRRVGAPVSIENLPFPPQTPLDRAEDRMVQWGGMSIRQQSSSGRRTQKWVERQQEEESDEEE